MSGGLRRMLHPAALALASLAALGACSSGDNDGSDAFSVARATLATAIATRNAPAGTGAPALSAEQVASAGVPLLIAVIEAKNLGTVLGQTGAASGGQTFSTADGITISVRDGLLLATRGFGEDLMSAEAPVARQIASGSGGHARSYQLLDGLDRTVTYRFDCSLSPAGVDTLTIGGRQFRTRVIAETCTASNAATRLDHRFWISDGGKIRQSRQWAGPGVGFLHLQHP